MKYPLTGNVQVGPRKRPESILEAAEQAVEIAMEEMDVAWVNLRGARERLQMVRDHERWATMKQSEIVNR